MLGKNRTTLDSINVELESASGDDLFVLGSVTLDTKIGDQQYPISYVVVRNLLTSVILGKQTLNNLKAIIDCEYGTLTVKKFGKSTTSKTRKTNEIDVANVSDVVINHIVFSMSSVARF